MEWRFLYWWVLPGLIVPLILPWWRTRRGGAAFGAYELASMVLRPSRGPLVHRILLAVALACLVVAGARPQWGRTIEVNEVQGRDLMIVVDLSLSMVVDDIVSADGDRMHRLDGVVEAAKAFIAGRKGDRIGLVFFGTEAILGCPLTFDHPTVVRFLDDIRDRQKAAWRDGFSRGREEASALLGPATNLGYGIGEALASLRDESSDGRAMIVITDGKDTEPEGLEGKWVDPLVAAGHAREMEVNVYAIGLGDRNGTWTEPHQLFKYGRGRQIPVSGNFLPDMNRLKEIVDAGDGLVMRADDLSQLDEVFDRIDQLEPSHHEVHEVDRYSDRFRLPLALGILLLACALIAEPRLRGVP